MSLRDFDVARDKFTLDDDTGLFAFPCCACVHRRKQATEEPCQTCDHNGNAVPDDVAYNRAKMAGRKDRP